MTRIDAMSRVLQIGVSTPAGEYVTGRALRAALEHAHQTARIEHRSMTVFLAYDAHGLPTRLMSNEHVILIRTRTRAYDEAPI